jgi:hypothetical protein
MMWVMSPGAIPSAFRPPISHPVPWPKILRSTALSRLRVDYDRVAAAHDQRTGQVEANAVVRLIRSHSPAHFREHFSPATRPELLMETIMTMAFAIIHKRSNTS